MDKIEIDFGANTLFLKGRLTQHLQIGKFFNKKNCDIYIEDGFVLDGILDLTKIT